MFWRLVLKSLNGNKAKLLAGFLALLLAALLVSALLAVVFDLPNSLGKELRQFGANYTLKAGRKPFSEESLKKLKKKPLSDVVLAYASFAEIKIKKDFKTYTLIGTDLKALKKISPWMRLSSLNLRENEVLAGQDVAEVLGLKKGTELDFTSFIAKTPKRIASNNCISCHAISSSPNHKERLGKKPGISKCLECHDRHEVRERFNSNLVVAGFISGGGDEDGQFFADSQTVLGMKSSAGYRSVSLSVLTSKMPQKRFVGIIKANFDGARLQSNKQISQAEKGLLSKIKLLMILMTIVVLMTCGLSVTSMLSGAVMERRTEIGLMKALGASHSNITLLFAAELSTIALSAGFLGYFGGLGLAALLAQAVFKVTISPSLNIMLLSMASALILALVASVTPIRSALRIEPAVTLRGE